MLTVSQLNEWLNICEQQPIVYSQALSKEQKAILQIESDIFLRCLKNIVAQNLLTPEQEIPELRLRVLLQQRALIIHMHSNDYTHHPHHPVNRLYLQIAQALAKPEEAVCAVLMPYIESLCRESYSLKAETEDDNGFFYPEHYLLKEKKLIPVAEIYAQALLNPSYLFDDFFSYHLNDYDRKNLKLIAEEACQNYLVALHEEHLLHQQNNLGHHLQILANALYDASVEAKGTEEDAHEDIAKAVKVFYEFWRRLPNNEEINQLTVPEWGRKNVTLKDYLLTLFVRYLDVDLLSDDERQRFTDTAIFPCAYQLSNALNEFLRRYSQLYRISINAIEPNSTSNYQELSELKVKALEALNFRGQIVTTTPTSSDFFRFILDTKELSFAERIQFISQLINTENDLWHFLVSVNDKKQQGLLQVTDYEELVKKVLYALTSKLTTITYQTVEKVIEPLSPENQMVLIELMPDYWLNVAHENSSKLKKITESFKSPAREQYILAVTKEAAARTLLSTDISTYYSLLKSCPEVLKAYLQLIRQKFPYDVDLIIKTTDVSSLHMLLRDWYEELRHWHSEREERNMEVRGLPFFGLFSNNVRILPPPSKVNIEPILSQIETWLKDQTLSQEEVIDFFENQTLVKNSATLSKWINFTVLAQLTPEKKLLEELNANFYELNDKLNAQRAPSGFLFFRDQSRYVAQMERLQEIRTNLLHFIADTDTSLNLHQLKDYFYQQIEEERNDLQRRYQAEESVFLRTLDSAIQIVQRYIDKQYPSLKQLMEKHSHSGLISSSNFSLKL